MAAWKSLVDISELDTIAKQSYQKPQLIFKHSTRCSISAMALDRLNRKWKFSSSEIEPYYLDLLQHRDISNQIAQQWEVPHQSPQVLVIKNNQCIYHASHNDICVEDIEQILNS
ncbi:MAG: bacillithiol system redox-active protein YtxJ [Bacteroidia bacterium]|nr:bacillithiol system redox-active protein YtxJ [Bacteroidia bacterium]MDW8300978.1 bacillithiol system redox-active protein YtxJ [Bacteroidia bacterium]